MLSETRFKNIVKINEFLTKKNIFKTLNKKIERLLQPYEVKRVIFLAAGFGERLNPITKSIPKPLVKVNGVRIIEKSIDCFLARGIEEIIVVTGYMKESFDHIKKKYPMIKFIDNDEYDVANNISSIYAARDYLENSYIVDGDLLIYNPDIISKYHYCSNFMGIKTNSTEDWCFEVKDNLITNEKKGGTGDNIYTVVGISYWNREDGHRLAKDIEEEYVIKNNKDLYWEFVPLINQKDNYKVYIKECLKKDVEEIDTFEELLAIDNSYINYLSK